MLYIRRFVVAALAALAATSPVLAEQRLTPSQPVALVRSSAQDLPTQKVDTTAFGVAGVPRGGKKADAAPAAFVSQSASVLMGLILALNSGFINGCALSGVLAADGSSQAVSAVTASWTNSALGLAAGNMAKFGFLGKVLGSYIFGSLVAGYCQPNPSPFLVSSSSYGLPLTIAAGSMIIAKMFLDDASSVKLGFYVLAIANGINNSVTSTMTSNLCRTAHFSGISSDMGTFIGQILRGNKANLFKLKVFAGLGACFWSGGYLSYEISKTYGSSSLYISALVYLFVAGGYDKVAKKMFA
mmetsp:Transcript_97655/g.273249  ORF Transcript_97655/g.273249 Transcript_97655/m.273249 type:complete len:299 (+) Transcript_97655:50-946(+)